MSNIEALKEQARRHEQKEEWQKACDLYLRAIQRLNEEEQPDIGLYNRVGDLLVRLGNYEQAVENFERATDLYLEAELPNNAIAVCKKVLRHLPTRSETYLRMGKIRASQGFLVDARENFLAYAEAMQTAGETDDALRALVEFADLAMEDTEVRMSVALQLIQHERPLEALDQLVAGYRVLRARDDHESARAFEEKILELDPEADLKALVGPETAAHPFESEATSLDGGDDHGLEADFGEIVAPESEADRVGEPADGPVPDVAAPDAVVEAAEGADEAIGEFEEISFVGDGVEGPADHVPAPGEPEDEAEDDAEDLPLLAGFEEEDEVDLEPLPFLSVDEPESGDEETGAVSWEGPSWGEAEPETDTVHEDVGREAAVRVPPREQWVALREVIRQDPADLASCHDLVEVAFQLDDQEALVESYLALARALLDAGETDRSASVVQQVLALDPGNAEGRSLLVADSGSGAIGAEKEGAGGFVDLGALVFGEDEGPRTTRFRVAYEEPSGDEEADFARMLSQFKAKVAENFDHTDVKAHHDLGTAYKEMGLLPEAVEKFQQALRAAPDHLPTLELLGQTFMEKGEHTAAVRALERALRVPTPVEDDLIGIYYYLARAHEELGQVERAIEFYERVFALDINFSDVTERLRRLR